jgi:hypothetical protein
MRKRFAGFRGCLIGPQSQPHGQTQVLHPWGSLYAPLLMGACLRTVAAFAVGPAFPISPRAHERIRAGIDRRFRGRVAPDPLG